MQVRTFENKQPQIAQRVYIDPSAVVIGHVTLADDVSVWPTSVIRGDVAAIDIGEGTNIQDGCILHVSHASPYTEKEYPLVIGQGVTVGHKAVVHACTVGDYCLIGIGAIILDNAVIENYVIVGAGSVVLSGQRLNSGYLYVGTPAKKIRVLTDNERESLEYSCQHYIQLKNKYLS